MQLHAPIIPSLSDPLAPAGILMNFSINRSMFGSEIAHSNDLIPFSEPIVVGRDDETADFYYTISFGKTAHVLATRLGDADKATVETKITALIASFQARGVQNSISFWVGAAASPDPVVRAVLVQKGFRYEVDPHTAMVLETASYDVTSPRFAFTVPPNLEIVEITTEEELHILLDVQARAFEASHWVAAQFGKAYKRMGYIAADPRASWRHFLARIEGTPVAGGSLEFAGGVVGITNLGVVPEARRRGVAKALTWHLMVRAKELGYGFVTLGPEEASRPIYERFGFKDFLQIEMYVSKISSAESLE